MCAPISEELGKKEREKEREKAKKE